MLTSEALRVKEDSKTQTKFIEKIVNGDLKHGYMVLFGGRLFLAGCSVMHWPPIRH